MKSEPSTYAWADLEREGRTLWDGVRNFQARNHLRAMKLGDLAFFYHSMKDKACVGIVEVCREAYPDPTAQSGDWSVVDIKPRCVLASPVNLATIKATPELAEIALIKQSRLSVMPLPAAAFRRIAALGKTRVPA